MILDVQGEIPYFTVCLNDSYFKIMFWNAFFETAICERTNKTFAWWKEFEPCEKQPI